MKSERVIVIATAGWVFTGFTDLNDKNQVHRNDLGDVVLSQAACIRVWGTDAGIGQLALYGPQKETILDPIGVMDIPNHSVIGILRCVEEPWTAHEAKTAKSTKKK